MAIVNINSFDDLIKLVKSHDYSNFIYRGEDSSKYELRSSFGRDQLSSPQNIQSLERSYFCEFKRKATPYLEYDSQNDLDWLTVAQHHGLHTRLLDWTSNPLVAAYFSTKIIQNEDSILYALDTRKIKDANNIVNPFDIDQVYIFQPRHITRRIIAQSGLFTIHPKPIDIFTHPALERIVIKKQARADIYILLGVFGINEFSLFPDLQGLSSTLTENWIR